MSTSLLAALGGPSTAKAPGHDETCALCFFSSSRVLGTTVAVEAHNASVDRLSIWVCNVCKEHDDMTSALPQVGILNDEFQVNASFSAQFAAKLALNFRRALLVGHVELVAEITDIITTDPHRSACASLRHCFAALIQHQRTRIALPPGIAASAATLHAMNQSTADAHQPTLRGMVLFAYQTKQTGAFVLLTREMRLTRNCRLLRECMTLMRLSAEDPRERRMFSHMLEADTQNQCQFTSIGIQLPDIVTRIVDVAERAMRDKDDGQSRGVLMSLSPLLVATLATSLTNQSGSGARGESLTRHAPTYRECRSDKRHLDFSFAPERDARMRLEMLALERRLYDHKEIAISKLMARDKLSKFAHSPMSAASSSSSNGDNDWQLDFGRRVVARRLSDAQDEHEDEARLTDHEMFMPNCYSRETQRESFEALDSDQETLPASFSARAQAVEDPSMRNGACASPAIPSEVGDECMRYENEVETKAASTCDSSDDVGFDDEYEYEAAESAEDSEAMEVGLYGLNRNNNSSDGDLDDDDDEVEDEIDRLVNLTRRSHPKKRRRELRGDWNIGCQDEGQFVDDVEHALWLGPSRPARLVGSTSAMSAPARTKFAGLEVLVSPRTRFTTETVESLALAIFTLASELLPHTMGERDASLAECALRSPDLYFSPEIRKKTLIACAQNRNEVVMRVLLKTPEFLEVLDDYEVVRDCARVGLVDAVQRIVTRDGNPVKNGATALQAAAEEGQLLVAELLLRVADPCLADHRSALKAATLNGHSDLVEMLVNCGKLQPTDSMVSYVLGLAARRQHQKCVIVLHNFVKFNLVYFQETKDDVKAALTKVNDPFMRIACFCLRDKIPGDIVREAIAFCEW